MSSRFYFGGSDDSGSDLENDSSLPFPKPLDRGAFLAPNFDPTTFLSNLSTRFQTLEDLQTELRELSQSLNKELVDLVNDNYQDFLSLGSTLRGGDEKIEEIRVGLLGFQRDITSVKEKVDQRRHKVAELLDQKRVVKQDIGHGRELLDIAERVEALEGQLGIARIETGIANGEEHDGAVNASLLDSSEVDDDDVDDEGSFKLKGWVEQYLILKLLIRKHDSKHPFLVGQQQRVKHIRMTLLLDLEADQKQAPDEMRQDFSQLRRMIDEN